MDTLSILDREFVLARVPEVPRRPLRAWDAADEYAIAEVAERGDLAPGRLLIVGDRFGALSCALDRFDPVVTCESAAGREAIGANRARNDLAEIEVASLLDLDGWAAEGRSFDVVVVRLPKSINALSDIAHRLRPVLAPGAVVVGAVMAKHLTRAMVEQLSAIVGPAESSRAVRKARLVRAAFDPSAPEGSEPNPWPLEWRAHRCTLVNHGGGFSPERLDAGTGFVLRELEPLVDDIAGDPEHRDRRLRVVDLGCGNGIIGLVVANRMADAGRDVEIVAVDDSALAVDATRASWKRTRPDDIGSLVAHHAHRLASVVDEGSVDLVVVNPPFHDDHVVGDDIAWSMFVDARRVLRPGGSLVVVGNRHLGYHAKVRKIFGNGEVIASNATFVVLRSTRLGSDT